MTIEITELNHVNVTVPKAVEEAAKHFYGVILGLKEVPKPQESRGRGGAWYQLGGVQLHLSIEDGALNEASKRHVCYLVRDLTTAEAHFRATGVEVIPDNLPVRGWP